MDEAGVLPPRAGHVVFPSGQRPDQSPVYAKNELLVAAPSEHIWAWLVRAHRWPEWYANAKDVEIDGGARELSLGAPFHWTTFGLRVRTVVEEFVPLRRLAWSGKVLGASAYHGWVITPSVGGCLVVTEETQQGILPRLGQPILRRGLVRWHQRWLEGLARMASSGTP